MFFGILSGVAAMYATAIVNQVVKPVKPLANFAVETDGLTATFHNRYAGEGWWDFGDGSALEPATADQESISHTYLKPGTYSAKLTVQNFVGDSNDRSVPIQVTVQSTTNSSPIIGAFDAMATSSDHSAPATYRFFAQTANAERCLWDLGPDRGVEVVSEAMGKQERYVTFAAPGQHTVQLTVLNGDQAIHRSVTVQVDPPRPGAFVARLLVTDRGARIDKRQTIERIPVTLARNPRDVVPIDRKISPRHGFSIVEAKLGHVDPAFGNLKLSVAADHRSLQVTGSLTPTAAMIEASSPPAIPILMSLERQQQLTSPPAEIVASIVAPGTGKLPLPAIPNNVTKPERTMTLELHGADGSWQLPIQNSSNIIEYQGRRLTVATAYSEKEVRIDIKPAAASVTMHQ
jgi:hypothetical protein